MKIHELSIRKKLVIGFGIIAFITLIISVLAIYQIQIISKNSNFMYKHPLTVSNSVRDINIYINAIHRSMKDVVLAKNKEQIDSTLELIDGYNNKVLEAFNIVFDRFLGNKKDVEEAYAYFKNWERIRNEVIFLKIKGEDEAASDITTGKEADHVEQLLRKTKVMTDFAQQKADSFYKQVKNTQQNSKVIFVLIIIVLLIISLLFAYTISNSISKPIISFISNISKIFSDQEKVFIKENKISENELLDKTVIELKKLYKKIQESKKELELKVEQRTKDLIKNEKVLKENIEEYQALNEEYLSQNEELLESMKRIQKINEELGLAKKKAEESDKLKSAFLANMSHEIRTPMNGIIGFSEMFMNPKLTKEKRNYYAKIVIESSNRLLTIVNDILDISRIETGLVEINRERVDVNEVAIQLYDFFYPKSQMSEVQLKLDKGLDDEANIIITDKTKLTQILSNLLSNAFKFTSKGYIHFGYELIENNLQFFVKDTGIGIDKKIHDKIFERFRQGDLETTRHYGGTGLGLAISKKLVELLEGSIWLESEKEKGTTFYFTIPYLSVKKIKVTTTKKQEQLKLNIANSTILVAEDEDINYIYIEEILKHEKVNIVRARNGNEAIEYCKQNPAIDLILMDIKMQVVNGFEAAKQIKQFRPDLPIIAQTALALSGDKEKALNNSCDDYISKPILKKDLIELIYKYMGK